jgi:carbonic anhydrase
LTQLSLLGYHLEIPTLSLTLEVAQAVLRDLVISQQLLGTNEVLLLKQTVYETFRNQDVVGIVKKIGAQAVWELGHFLMGTFAFLGP